MFPDEVKIRLHSPMVRPLVIHEFVKFIAGVFVAVTTEFKIFVYGTVPELTLLNRIID